jgi:hypothetical protein
MKFGNEFWLILFPDYIIPNLFAVYYNILYDCGNTAKFYSQTNVMFITSREIQLKDRNFHGARVSVKENFSV